MLSHKQALQLVYVLLMTKIVCERAPFIIYGVHNVGCAIECIRSCIDLSDTAIELVFLWFPVM